MLSFGLPAGAFALLLEPDTPSPWEPLWRVPTFFAGDFRFLLS